jgi:hypothetical protein
MVEWTSLPPFLRGVGIEFTAKQAVFAGKRLEMQNARTQGKTETQGRKEAKAQEKTKTQGRKEARLCSRLEANLHLRRRGIVSC